MHLLHRRTVSTEQKVPTFCMSTQNTHNTVPRDGAILSVQVILFQTLRHRTNKNSRLEEQEMGKFRQGLNLNFSLATDALGRQFGTL